MGVHAAAAECIMGLEPWQRQYMKPIKQGSVQPWRMPTAWLRKAAHARAAARCSVHAAALPAVQAVCPDMLWEGTKGLLLPCKEERSQPKVVHLQAVHGGTWTQAIQEVHDQHGTSTTQAQ